MTRILIIGPPGSGKGTQAARISQHLGVAVVSTGDIFRDNVRGGTPLGIEAKKFLDAGDFVPDSVTNCMVRDRLAGEDLQDGFILDGYPRTASQVSALDNILRDCNLTLDGAVELLVDSQHLVTRMLRRAKLEGRSDDDERIIRHRLGLYRDQTKEVISKYALRGIVTKVDGIGTVEEVTERIITALPFLRQDHAKS